MVSTGLTGPLSLIDPHLLLLNVGNCEFGAISACIFIEAPVGALGPKCTRKLALWLCETFRCYCFRSTALRPHCCNTGERYFLIYCKSHVVKKGGKIIACIWSLFVDNGNLFGTATEVFISEESSFYFNINAFATRQDQYIFLKKNCKKFTEQNISLWCD